MYNFTKNLVSSVASGSAKRCSSRRSSSELCTAADPKPHRPAGQPTHATHPHLVAPGELAPGLRLAEFSARRTEFMRRLAREDKHKGHTVLIPAAPKQFMSDKIPYIFRQSSDLYYLTGCLEPDSLLMMTSLPGTENIHQTILFVRGQDHHSELWDGPRTGVDDAPQMFRVDASLPFADLTAYLTSHFKGHKGDQLWYSSGSPLHKEADFSIRKSITNTHSPSCPRKVLAVQRNIKSPAEAALMLQACEVGSTAINSAMACTRPGVSEHDIHAALDYWSRRAGAEHLAFPPVVGGGPRATAIHYILDNQQLSDGELLLVDAGCQRFAYNSDISRTWPVSGRFSSAQATLYDIVLSVQQKLLAALSAGQPTLDSLFDLMCTTLGSHLREEGIIKKGTSDNDCAVLAYKYCPHHVSHYLGLDVHDTPSIPRNIPVQPGMVVTVEPGIYISAKDTAIPVEFRGIGIRIEDDVLITHGEPLILTESCYKHRSDIEAIVGSRILPE